ncbi:MAG: ROK family transcriptional regulator [Caldilineaceae bacterium]
MNFLLSRPETSKEFNRRLVLNQIRQHDGIARSDIVRLTGLSKATVSAIVADLMETGLVVENGNQNSPVGRPRIALALVPDANFAVGVELTDEECRVVLVNLHAEPVRRVSRPVANADLTVASLLHLLESCVAEVTAGIDQQRILALGVCIPGIVNPPQGVVTYSVILPWQNVALGEALSACFAYPVAVFSRGTAATWGERWYGAGKAVENLLYIRVGSGIVGGLVLHGQPYLGRHFGAGELGHVTVDPDGLRCRCGNRGCLATVATTGALLNRVRHLLQTAPSNAPADGLWQKVQQQPDDLTLTDVVMAANTGNQVAIQAFAEVGRWVGVATAAAVNLLNLEMLIVGGPLARAGEHLLQPLRAELAQRTLPIHLAQLLVVTSVLKEDAPAIGAASLVLHELMSPLQPAITPALSSDGVSLF